MAHVLNALVEDLDVKCSCGWFMPHSVMPHKNVSDLDESTIVPGIVVALCCPQCGHGHSFYSLTAAADAPKDVQRRLGLDVDDKDLRRLLGADD